MSARRMEMLSVELLEGGPKGDRSVSGVVTYALCHLTESIRLSQTRPRWSDHGEGTAAICEARGAFAAEQSFWGGCQAAGSRMIGRWSSPRTLPA